MLLDLGYTENDFSILSNVHAQSPDISQAVDKIDSQEIGAGDQGIMFGYATNETDSFMPLPIMIAHDLVRTCEELRISGDKDIKSDNKNKCYCIEQCIFVTQAENVKQSNKHRDNTKFQGENHYLFGNHRSEETKKKISERNKGKNNPRSKRIAQYDFDGNLIRIWDYMKQAETELGIKSNNICSCCRGKLKSAGGFIWKYVD